MHPGMVWLQLIPLFNYLWAFIVVRRIADSLSKQYTVFQSDSIFGTADEDAKKAIGKRPTYGIGLAYCLLLLSVPLVVIFFNLFAEFRPVSAENPVTSGADVALGFSIVILVLAAIVCWIIYWVQLVACKKKLRHFAAA